MEGRVLELNLPLLKSPQGSRTIRLAAFALIVSTALSGVEGSQSTDAGPSGAVRGPVAVSRVAPVYPDDAIKARVEGVVILEATVSETGRVTDAKVVRGPSPSLMESARIAVLQWRYEPARLKGAAISTTVTVSINFNLPSTAAGNMRNAGSTRGSTSANTAASSGPSSAKLPPLRLEDTSWFCTIKLSEGREFDGFVQFRSDNTVKLVETVRRNWPDTDYGPGGTDKPIMWPVLYPGYNGEEQIAHLRNPNAPGNAGDRWASTTDEARFFTTTVGQVYRLSAKGGQLVGTIHSPEARSAERYYKNFTSTPVFDVGFLNPPVGSIACAPARAWMQR